MRIGKLAQRFWLCGGLLTFIGSRQPRGLALGLLGVLALAAPETVLRPAQAAILSSWEFDSARNQLEFMVQQGAKPTYSVIGQPPRIVLDLPNTQLGENPTQKTYSGIVRQIQVTQLQGGITRIIMEFAPEVALDPAQVQLQRVSVPIENGPFRDRWVLRPLGSAPTGFEGSPASGGWRTPSDAVSVPPLQQSSAARADFPRPTTATNFGQTLPQLPASNPLGSIPLSLPAETSAIAAPSATVVVPPLERAPARGARRVGVANRALVSYGTRVGQAVDVYLPAGTQMSVQYTGEKVLGLEADFNRQEVLFLQEAIFDRAGNVIIPEGTPVIGRFESNRRGRRFIAQAITLSGRNIPLEAQSERFSQLAILEPGQSVQIRLKEALR